MALQPRVNGQFVVEHPHQDATGSVPGHQDTPGLRSDDETRGYITDAVFEALYLDERDVVDSDLHEPFHSVAEAHHGPNAKRPDEQVEAPSPG